MMFVSLQKCCMRLERNEGQHQQNGDTDLQQDPDHNDNVTEDEEGGAVVDRS
jgi:hypothetical protein